MAVSKPELEMKVSTKKSIGFYISSAAAFLRGVDAKEASEGNEAVEAKPPVDVLTITGIGEAINAAIASAVRAESDGLGEITKIQTLYPTMQNDRGVAQIAITMKRKC
eukprot:TRINITY_DN67828_c0_g1_i1.p1 TRINITY_DN67828_c0_g1~~TRINITY_DN67828_c0_g1_i1.p1  ORF type:complete len:108 (-),score=24.82 TRINITY_DN67828_c0_g1_i1:116-439(-)